MSIESIVKKLVENRIHEATSYKGYTLKYESDDQKVESHVIIYKGDEKVASAADDEEAKSIIDNELTESKINEEDEGYNQFLEAMRSNPTYKKISAVCANYNYKLFFAYREDYGHNRMSTTITIRETRRYQPEIYYQNSFGQDNYEFKIQTSAYGALTLEEHAEYLENVTEAHELVAELSKMDFSGLFLLKEEE